MSRATARYQVREKTASQPATGDVRAQVDRLFAAADRLAALNLPPLTREEIEHEIQAARDERHERSARATGRR